jgi:hypothetical protein
MDRRHLRQLLNNENPRSESMTDTETTQASAVEPADDAVVYILTPRPETRAEIEKLIEQCRNRRRSQAVPFCGEKL